MRRVTIRDVAQAAGVSSATVSYVMNGLGKVTPQVEAEVLRIATELGYSRNRAAAALKTGRSQVIGCLLPTLVSPIFPQIAQAVQKHAASHGFATLLVDTGDSLHGEEQSLARLRDFGVDGAVAVLHPADGRSAPLPFPVVAIDAPVKGCDSVRADHMAGGRLMAEYAAVLGHRRIGLLSGSPDVRSSRERRQGIRDVAASLGITVSWDHVVPLAAGLTDEARQAIARHDVTLIACVNDFVAIGALSALRDLGIAVPQDVSVIGFDDIEMSSWPLVALTTVRQPLQELGRRAVDLLARRLRDPGCPIEEVLLPVDLVVRGSTAYHAPAG